MPPQIDQLKSEFLQRFEHWGNFHARTRKGTRWFTFREALIELIGMADHRLRLAVVETGCARAPDDHGAGYSTILFDQFSEWAAERNLVVSVDSVDVSRENVVFCKGELRPRSTVRLHIRDSVEWLGKRTRPIHLLYLDSADYPYGEIFDAFTEGKHDQASIDFIENEVDPERIWDRCSASIIKCQSHCLEELRAADNRIAPGGLVLIDDWGLPCGGKAGLARDYMRRNGFHLVCEAFQTLWKKDVTRQRRCDARPKAPDSAACR